MRSSFLVVMLSLIGWSAKACLRPILDERTVQWSTLIVEARLIDVSERVEIKAISVKPMKGTKGPELSAVYWYRLYSFEVVTALDGVAKPKYRVEAIRFFGRVAEAGSAGAAASLPSAAARPTSSTPLNAVKLDCDTALTRASIGKVFYLFVRPEQDLKLEKPPVWSDPKADLREKEIHDVKGLAVIHLIPADKVGPTELIGMKKLIGETRSTERKAADPEIKKRVQWMIAGNEAQGVDAATAELRKIGWRTVGAMKSSRDKGEATAEGEERLLKLISELSPPTMPLEMGLSVE